MENSSKNNESAADRISLTIDVSIFLEIWMVWVFKEEDSENNC